MIEASIPTGHEVVASAVVEVLRKSYFHVLNSSQFLVAPTEVLLNQNGIPVSLGGHCPCVFFLLYSRILIMEL